MGRRRTIFEELIELAARMPWWGGIVLALISYVVLHPFVTQTVFSPSDINHLGTAMVHQAVRVFATIGQYLVPGAFLLGSVVSAFKQAKRHHLVEKTSEVTSHDSVKSLSWREFEMLVSEVFRRRGYTAQETADGADGGVDIVLRKDGELSLVQCKHWRANKVGVAVVRELFGIMAAKGATQGFVVTSGTFSREAQRFAEGRNIELVDGSKLDTMLRRIKRIESQLKPARTNTDASSKGHYSKVVALKRTPDCPKCGEAMVKRVARKGPYAGREFWGCSRYPKCRGVRAVK